MSVGKFRKLVEDCDKNSTSINALERGFRMFAVCLELPIITNQICNKTM
jgi:hypothetical protein